MLPTSMSKICSGLIVLAAIFAGVCVTAPNADAKAKLHVSYLWHHDLKSVRSYRQAVGSVLGSSVEKKLKIFKKGKLFGLIYLRSGNHGGAVRSARLHSLL